MKIYIILFVCLGKSHRIFLSSTTERPFQLKHQPGTPLPAPMSFTIPANIDIVVDNAKILPNSESVSFRTRSNQRLPSRPRSPSFNRWDSMGATEMTNFTNKRLPKMSILQDPISTKHLTARSILRAPFPYGSLDNTMFKGLKSAAAILRQLEIEDARESATAKDSSLFLPRKPVRTHSREDIASLGSMASSSASSRR